MSELTYEQAKEISVEIWDYTRKNGLKPNISQIYKIMDKTSSDYIFPISKLYNDCGFCEFFNANCNQCPLKWHNAVEEKYSLFCNNSLKCSRNFWHWAYWEGEYKKNNTDLWIKIHSPGSVMYHMKYWAEKMYQEIIHTPMHLR